MSQSTASEFQTLLALAVQWAEEQESIIRRDGFALSPDQLKDAAAVGVLHPNRIRLLAVPAIPVPAHPILKSAYATMNFFTEAPRGLTLNYGIFLNDEAVHDRELLLHELAHTMQYERLGMAGFLAEYLTQCSSVGYRSAPLELEAAERCASILAARKSKVFSISPVLAHTR